MAKQIIGNYYKKPKKKRKGIHAKSKQSSLKSSKLYWNIQGWPIEAVVSVFEQRGQDKDCHVQPYSLNCRSCSPEG